MLSGQLTAEAATKVLVIAGGTVMDGVSEKPLDGQTIWIERGRIKAIGRRDDLRSSKDVSVIDATGKYVIAGLMNANVHLLGDARLENLLRHDGQYEELILEAAQVALKNGLTTVFDTWGPRRHLMAVRDEIAAGKQIGSRIFCAGNIIGFDGPLSADFFAKDAEVASVEVGRRINATWVENVGRHLMWRTPDEVSKAVRTYIGRGIDFVKYASNEHFPGAFLAFSPAAQERIVDEAHRVGLTAQAHTLSVEGLRIAVEAGCDLIQHANITGPTEIPLATLELMAARNTAAVVFPWTERALKWLVERTSDVTRTNWHAADANVRRLIHSGVALLMANDGTLFSTDLASDPLFRNGQWGMPGEDSLISLASGHFVWLRAMEEKGCPPIALLRAATSNIAAAYGKETELGTIEPGKIADLLILDKNPLEAAENYRCIHTIIKEGALVDRDALPSRPVLTAPARAPADEEASYVPFLHTSGTFPSCPACPR